MRYLNAAFWAKTSVPLLGEVPFNVLGLTAFGLLGFGEPAFWLLGLGLETAFLFVLSTNPRFQKVVDAQGRVLTQPDDEGANRAEVIARLNPIQRRRLAALETKVARIFKVYEEQGVDEFTVASNRDALNRLSWVFLKLLVAQRSLNETSDVNPADLQARIGQIEQELKLSRLTRTLRESKEATLSIMQQRLENFNQRAQSNDELESDLARIEAQTDLALESASLQGNTAVVSANIQLTSKLLNTGSFGDLSDTVTSIDRSFKMDSTADIPDDVKAVLNVPVKNVQQGSSNQRDAGPI